MCVCVWSIWENSSMRFQSSNWGGNDSSLGKYVTLHKKITTGHWRHALFKIVRFNIPTYINIANPSLGKQDSYIFRELILNELSAPDISLIPKKGQEWILSTVQFISHCKVGKFKSWLVYWRSEITVICSYDISSVSCFALTEEKNTTSARNY